MNRCYFVCLLLKEQSLFTEKKKKKLCQAEIKYIFKDKKGSEKKKKKPHTSQTSHYPLGRFPLGICNHIYIWAGVEEGVSQVALVVKNLPASAGDDRNMRLIPGLERSPGRGHGYPFQCS